MQTFFNRVTLYQNIQSVTDITSWLQECQGVVILDATVHNLGYQKFFAQLEQFEKLRSATRSKTHNVQAKALEILVPHNVKDVALFTKTVMKEIFNREKHLPYVAWLETKGKGIYVKLLISERYYSEKEIIYEDKWTSDRYQNQITGRLCKKTDPNAKRIVKSGDIRKTWTSHFSLKSRLFTADAFAKKSRDRKERIGFDRLLNHLRQCIVTSLVKMNIPFTKAFTIPKLKRKEWMNKYQHINLTKINQAIQYIEQEIQKLWVVVRDGYFAQDQKTYDRFMALAYKWLVRIKKRSFRVNKKFKFSFCIWMNVVKLQENLDCLIDNFNNDLNKFVKEYIEFC